MDTHSVLKKRGVKIAFIVSSSLGVSYQALKLLATKLPARTPRRKGVLKRTIVSAKLWQHALLNTAQASIQTAVMVRNDFYTLSQGLSIASDLVTSILSAPSSFPLFGVLAQVSSCMVNPFVWTALLVTRNSQSVAAALACAVAFLFDVGFSGAAAFMTARKRSLPAAAIAIAIFDVATGALLCQLATHFITTLRLGVKRRARFFAHGTLTALAQVAKAGFAGWFFVDLMHTPGFEDGAAGDTRRVVFWTFEALLGAALALFLASFVLFLVDASSAAFKERHSVFSFYFRFKRRRESDEAASVVTALSKGGHAIIGGSGEQRRY